MIPDPYKAMTSADFLAAGGTIVPQSPLIYFFQGSDVNTVNAVAKADLGMPVTYTDKDGNIIGYAVANFDAQLKPDTSFPAEIALLLQSPVMPLLAILLVTALTVTGISATKTFSGGGRLKVEAFEAQTNLIPADQSDNGEAPIAEIKFNLRIRLPRVKSGREK
jgi:hypothetical protein